MGEFAPLSGLRVLDCSLLEPAALGALLGELGADVVKVEAPGAGDYIRNVAWPIIDGVSLLHWHSNRAKRSVTLDLREPAGCEVFLDLVGVSDVVVEGMRPGSLARRGLTRERIREVNPQIVGCSLSGYGGDGPYRDLPSHGIAFDAWAGIANPATNEDGFPSIPDHTSIGTKVAPVWAAMGVLAAVLMARQTGSGTWIDVAQSDVAAAVNWLTIEGWKAYSRPDDEVTGNASDNFARRPPGAEGMHDSVRYQYYATTDGFILFMASERKFWKNFCDGVGLPAMFEAQPGAEVADHARGNNELRGDLARIFATRSTAEWVAFGAEVDTPICPVNSPRSIEHDPQFRARMPWRPSSLHGADLLPSPLRFSEGELVAPRRSPTLGQHTTEVLSEVLGYSDEAIARLRTSGALGPGETG